MRLVVGVENVAGRLETTVAGAVRRLRARRGHDRLLTPVRHIASRWGTRRILLIVVGILWITTVMLWRENRQMARRIRIIEGAERIMNMRMLEIQEERLRLERMRWMRE